MAGLFMKSCNDFWEVMENMELDTGGSNKDSAWICFLSQFVKKKMLWAG